METLTVSPHMFTMKPTHHHIYQLQSQQQQRRSAVASTSTGNSLVFSPRTSDIIHSPSRSEMLCRYPSKLCDNIRSEKRGGGLHRFCAFHRERANINQRRVDHRRRLRRRGGVLSPTQRLHDKDAHHSSDEEHDYALADDTVSLDIDTFNFDPSEPLSAVLSEADLQVLIDLLEEPSTEALTITIKDEPKSESN